VVSLGPVLLVQGPLFLVLVFPSSCIRPHEILGALLGPTSRGEILVDTVPLDWLPGSCENFFSFAVF